MKKLAFFDTKPYDKEWFTPANDGYFQIKYFENKLNEDTANLARGCDGVVVFVNDTLNKTVIDLLYDNGIRVAALRCTGFNNVDFEAAFGKITVFRVPVYSPYAVAEHAIGLLLVVNRKLHKAFYRTRDYNFSLNGLTGFDLHGKTISVIGTGAIGKALVSIAQGFGMRVQAYDPYPDKSLSVSYVSLEEVWRNSDVISLHCPLNESTHHMINAETIAKMKPGVILINTSRGALIDSEALLDALKEKQIAAAGLDVYEEESELFFEDYSSEIVKDDILSRLISLPNVFLTSHQAFLTKEALESIANTTLDNLKRYFEGNELQNEIAYRCREENPRTCMESAH